VTETRALEPTGRDQLARRLQELRESPAYRNYRLVRERVFDMGARQQACDVAIPSTYWREELDHIDFMIDASPIMIDRLRRHCFYVTGIRPFQYREAEQPRQRLNFEAKLRALADLDRSNLLVPEARLLGGFGYEIDGALYNVDTLKFYEVLIALDRAGALDPFRRPDGGTMCEIGPGWGGFAYQFKTLFPRATLVLVDFPELFLFSATYLSTAFPEARIAFWGEPDAEAALTGSEPPDFVFVPHNEIGALAPPRLGLTVNMVSFQEMTTEQVRSYVRWASERRSRLYSLNRDRSGYNPELTNVRDVIQEAYELTELEILPISYTKLGDPWQAKGKRSKARIWPQRRRTAPVAQDRLDYHHVLGALRAS
jgi:hypothetical protein